jgi:hypothetical protein
MDDGGWRTFGAPIPNSPSVKAQDVLTSPDAYVGRELVLEGTPKTVCPKKGCWMIFADGARSMRVMFKDHAFFVPLDSAGTPMRMAGTLQVKTISEADAKHFLVDEGKNAEAEKLTGAQKELFFTATGVAIAPK